MAWETEGQHAAMARLMKHNREGEPFRATNYLVQAANAKPVTERSARRILARYKNHAPEVRERLVAELDRLADQPVPPIAAGTAAAWTRVRHGCVPDPPDALLDVWCALDDWLEVPPENRGAVTAAAWRVPGTVNRWSRLVTALTRFDTYVRYGSSA